jgi:hypothetical protein
VRQPDRWLDREGLLLPLLERECLTCGGSGFKCAQAGTIPVKCPSCDGIGTHLTCEGDLILQALRPRIEHMIESAIKDVLERRGVSE